MQNPSKDIVKVIRLIRTENSSEKQIAIANKHLAQDVGLRNPFCLVEQGPMSRNNVIGFYQWLRVVSREIDTDVKSVIFDKEHNIVILNIVEHFHIRLSPFKPAPCHFLSRITLRKEQDKFLICMIEDFFHPDDLANILFPPIAPVVRLGLSMANGVCNTGNRLVRFFGSLQDRLGSGQTEGHDEHEGERDGHDPETRTRKRRSDNDKSSEDRTPGNDKGEMQSKKGEILQEGDMGQKRLKTDDLSSGNERRRTGRGNGKRNRHSISPDKRSQYIQDFTVKERIP